MAFMGTEGERKMYSNARMGYCMAAVVSAATQGSRLYEMVASEVSGGYGIDAATVDSKTPASLRYDF